MPAEKVDLTIEQGADFSHGWMVTVNGQPVDETWTSRAQIRTKYDELLHEVATEITPEGAVVIAVTGAESTPWTWFDGYFDVKVEKDGIPLRVAQGRIIVDKQVTHD